MITLYGYDTVNTLKVLIMLEEIGAPYKVAEVNIHRGAQRLPRFLQLNPNGRVPVVGDDATGERITESGAILMALAERSGFGVPSGEQTKTLEWLAYQLSTQGPAFGQAEYWHRIAPNPPAAIARHYKLAAGRVLQQMENRLAATRYFAGQAYSIADIAFFGWTARAHRAGLSLAGLPHALRWHQTVACRPAVRRALARRWNADADPQP